MSGLTPEQKKRYDADGFVIVEDIIDTDECDRFVAHMMALHEGKETLAGFDGRNHDEWGRTFNQHLYDPQGMHMMLHPRLREPLRDCFDDEPEGIQTMYFWKGSEQNRHQDAYYLPGCMSAWMALTDVTADNGTIWVQPGSHKTELVTREVFRRPDGTLPDNVLFGPEYDKAVDALAERHGVAEVPAEVKKGGVVFFDGRLIHRGGPIGRPGSFRHVMANHYVAKHAPTWKHKGWMRYDFDGGVRDWAPAAEPDLIVEQTAR